MCLRGLSTKTWTTPCGILKGSTLVNILNRIIKIAKAVISRCIFVLYCFIGVWRVTQALQNDTYWLLLLTLCPLALETLHAITQKSTNQMKWLTPNILYFLVGAIPCIWLLELKLLDDRIMEGTLVSPIDNTNSSLSQSVNNIVGINASDEEWTLALEQILIFALVLAKWIAPKGDLELDELSQLLLVYIAAGADILELMETFSDDRVSQNSEIVYLIMSAWTWSLLQFTIVLTAYKDFPHVDSESTEPYVVGEPAPNSEQAGPSSLQKKTTDKTHSNGNAHANGRLTTANGTDREGSRANGIIDPVPVVVDVNAHDNLRTKEELAALLEGRRCFECFCCYNEIWGMVMSICFQDGPFFILRLVILFHYQVVTHMNIFFTAKNIFVIILLLNRIRAVVRQERNTWLGKMDVVKKDRRRKKDKSRTDLGLPPKTKSINATTTSNDPPL